MSFDSQSEYDLPKEEPNDANQLKNLQSEREQFSMGIKVENIINN